MIRRPINTPENGSINGASDNPWMAELGNFELQNGGVSVKGKGQLNSINAMDAYFTKILI